jgi:hypothetical protein
MAKPKTSPLTPLVTAIGHSLGFTGSSSRWFNKGWGTSTSQMGYAASDIDTYAAMLKQPWIAAAAKVRIFLLLSYMQQYYHEDAKIKEDVTKQFQEIPGSFETHQSKMASSICFGFSITDRWYKIDNRKAKIAGLNTIDQRYIQFNLRKDSTLETRFKKKDVDKELTDFIHIKNEDCFNLGNNPRGIATLERAVPFWEQYRLVMLAMAIAAQRQATPLLVGKVNAASYINPDGTALDAAKIMIEKLEEARNSGVMVVDILDEIKAIAQQTDGEFFVAVLRILRQGILMSFLLPETILGQGESGSGDSNLNSGHLEILRMSVRSEARIFGQELTEQLIRPMLEFNYGDIGDWGSFPLRADEPKDPNGLITALIGTVEKAILDTDRVANRVVELAGM